MIRKYAIALEEKNLELIQVLNKAVPVEPKDGMYFVFYAGPMMTEVQSPMIITENDLYDEYGYARENITFLL